MRNRTSRSSTSFWILCRRCFRRDDPRKALVSEDLITYVEDRKGHDRRYAIAPDKIKAEVGWYPGDHASQDGIRKTIKWYLRA